MKKLVFTLAICLIAGSAAFGQKKAVADAKREIGQQNPNFTEARNSIKQALEHADTKEQAETWFVAGKVEYSVYDTELNKEKYPNLGQNPDEKTKYNALYSMYFTYFEKAFTLDNQPNEKGKVKPKYTREMRTLLKGTRLDFVNAGSYFYNNEEWEKSMQSFNMFLDMPNIPLMVGEKFESLGDDSLEFQIQYYAALAALNMDNKAKAVEYLDGLRGKNYQEIAVLQLLASIHDEMNNDEAQIKILEEGAKKYPSEAYFILNLINKSLEKEDIQGAITYLNIAIESSPEDALLYDALGQVYRQNHENDKAIASLNKALELDPNFSQSYTNLGNVYYFMADETRLKSGEIEKTDRKASDAMYLQALEEYKQAIPFYEKAIELNPKDVNAVTNLRFVYYILNDSRYDRVDALYNNL